MVDLVNKLETEARNGRPDRLADGSVENSSALVLTVQSAQNGSDDDVATGDMRDNSFEPAINLALRVPHSSRTTPRCLSMRRKVVTAWCVATFSAGIERPLAAAASFNDISFNFSMRTVWR